MVCIYYDLMDMYHKGHQVQPPPPPPPQKNSKGSISKFKCTKLSQKFIKHMQIWTKPQNKRHSVK